MPAIDVAVVPSPDREDIEAPIVCHAINDPKLAAVNVGIPTALQLPDVVRQRVSAQIINLRLKLLFLLGRSYAVQKLGRVFRLPSG